MKYIVNLGYRHFEFTNSDEAMLFAEMAVEHKNRETDSDLDVGIYVTESEVTE